MESNLLRRISGLEANKNLVFLNLANNQIEVTASSRRKSRT